MWETEKTLLALMPNYNQLLAERGGAEIFLTEACNVVYDYLGHGCLCVIEFFPAWKEHTLEQHRREVEVIAALGSTQANRWLGLEPTVHLHRLDDQTIADRFFFGDANTLKALKSGYGLP